MIRPFDGPPLRTVLQADLRSRWKQWSLLGVVIGVVVAVAIGAAAGARRTASTFDRYTEWARTADVTVALFEPSAHRRVAEMDGIAQLSRWLTIPPVLQVVDGRVRPFPSDAPLAVYEDGFQQGVDRPLVLEGRLPTPGRAEVACVCAAISVAAAVVIRSALGRRAVADLRAP